jgi:hypothetical protein
VLSSGCGEKHSASGRVRATELGAEISKLPTVAELRSAWTAEGGCPYAGLLALSY